MSKKKIKNLLTNSIKVIVVVALACLGYKLNPISFLICIAASIVFNYFFEIQEKKRLHYLEEFKSAVLYMEQMVYSFKKRPKIRLALEDARKVGNDNIKKLIEQVEDMIDNKESENIYKEALGLIEERFKCKRIKSLHEFLIKVELRGGEYENYINIILKDIKDWNDRMLIFIQNVARVKRNVLISIFSTLITCGFIAYLVPAQYKYTSNGVYQLCSTILIVLMMASYYLVTQKMNIDWLEEGKGLSDNQVMRYYNVVEQGFRDYKSLKISEKLSYKKIKKRLEKELQKYFPDWIREVAMNLQNDTVQSAIENSYERAPFVLKRPIRKLLIDFEKYPVGIEPYDNLLVEFELDEVKSSMKMFYSINELGKDEAKEQISSIIDRNNKLAGHAEEMKMQDRIGASAMYASLPMIIGVVKIMVDMVLMISVFTSSIGNVLN